MAAHEIIYVLYGSAYDEAIPVMVILAFFIPPTYVNIMTDQVLIASGRQIDRDVDDGRSGDRQPSAQPRADPIRPSTITTTGRSGRRSR